MKTVDEGAIDDLVHGAMYFGSGGGGDPYLAQQFLSAAVRRHGPVRLMDPADLAPDALVLPVVSGGTPHALSERAHSAVEAKALRSAVEARAGRVCEAILPLQRGGVNAAVPVAIAAELGLPCLDSDLMRRTFPSIDMTLLRISGHPVQPITVVGGAGVVAEFSQGDDAVLGRLLRSVLPDLGLVALVSAYHLTAGQCTALGVRGSISECAQVGAGLASDEPASLRELGSRLQTAGARVVDTGVVTELIQNTADGTPRGTVSIATSEAFMRVDFQSENLVVSRDGVVLTTVPDLIGVLDIGSGRLMQTIDLVYGQEVAVIAGPVDDRWFTAAGLAAVGPRAFGYDIDPVRFDGRTVEVGPR